MPHAPIVKHGIRILLLGALASLAGGCASYRLHSSLVSSIPSADAPITMTYAITAAQVICPTNVPANTFPAFGEYTIDPDWLRIKLAEAACKARPDLFSQAPNALPVEITVTKVTSDMSVNMGENCLSCLTLTILPIYESDTADYMVEVKVTDPTAGPRKSLPVVFTIEQRNWNSLWPTGWIPVPGGKGSYTWGPGNARKKYGAMMFDSCVEAAARALGHKEPSAWKAP